MGVLKILAVTLSYQKAKSKSVAAAAGIVKSLALFGVIGGNASARGCIRLKLKA